MFWVAGIPQVMGNPEVMQNPGGIAVWRCWGAVLRLGQPEVRIQGVMGDLEVISEEIGVMEISRTLGEIISELMGSLEVMRAQRGHTQVSLQQCRCQKE